ncbi:glycine zipper 2TM domain-containing protein [Luteimonas aquatica]|uniref:glycine zipper 2TM domain-containing protein n=1 Tax=Luteimonas aquatica TaxID=450364 RepID=UPI001F567A31|nr:hypothetical protein [Luteimonas aquatica]
MKRLATSFLALGLAAAVGTASAQSGDGYYRDGDYYPQPTVDRYGNAGDSQYDYARVVRVDPVIESGYPASQRQRCRTRQDGYYTSNDGYDDYRNDGYRNDGYRDDGYRDDRYSRGSETGRNVATVIGGILGAAIGSQVGGGSARYATAAVGSMVGGMAGRGVYDSNQRNRQPPRRAEVTVCDPVPSDGDYYRVDTSRVAAYDVTYEYAGRRYTTRTNYHPGDRIRVRVDVRAE